eukprot:scaffold4823_cov98-Isochrysis_galbana.AAC.5
MATVDWADGGRCWRRGCGGACHSKRRRCRAGAEGRRPGSGDGRADRGAWRMAWAMGCVADRRGSHKSTQHGAAPREGVVQVRAEHAQLRVGWRAARRERGGQSTQPDQPGCRLQVAQIGLDRTDGGVAGCGRAERAAGGCCFLAGEALGECSGLGRVAERRAGAVRLDGHQSCPRGGAGARECESDEHGLRRAAGRGQAGTHSIVHHRHRRHHGISRLLGLSGCGHVPRHVPRHIPRHVLRHVPRHAPKHAPRPAPGKQVPGMDRGGVPRVRSGPHTPVLRRNSGRPPRATSGKHGKKDEPSHPLPPHGDERRRTRSVDGLARAVKAQCEGKTAGGDRRRATGGGVYRGGASVREHVGVVRVGDGDVDGGVGATERVTRPPGGGKGGGAYFEEEPLLRAWLSKRAAPWREARCWTARLRARSSAVTTHRSIGTPATALPPAAPRAVSAAADGDNGQRPHRPPIRGRGVAASRLGPAAGTREGGNVPPRRLVRGPTAPRAVLFSARSSTSSSVRRDGVGYWKRTVSGSWGSPAASASQQASSGVSCDVSPADMSGISGESDAARPSAGLMRLSKPTTAARAAARSAAGRSAEGAAGSACEARMEGSASLVGCAGDGAAACGACRALRRTVVTSYVTKLTALAADAWGAANAAGRAAGASAEAGRWAPGVMMAPRAAWAAASEPAARLGVCTTNIEGAVG